MSKAASQPRRLVGHGMIRVDADGKVRGQTRYLNDIRYRNVWHGVVVRSPVARGRFKALTLDPAFDWSRVVVATAEDIPGENVVHMHDRTMPLLGEVGGELLYRGEPVAVVAAKTLKLATEAAGHIRVEVEELPPLLTLQETVDIFKKTPKRFVSMQDKNIVKGDLAKGFAEADEILEAEYWAGHQEQLYIENQGIVVFPQKDGSILAEGSLQCPYFPVNELNDPLQLPPEKIRVRQTPVGGAFGGKEEYPTMLVGYAALPALKSGRPVKITYERHEDILFTPKRHPVWVRYKTGFKKDGTLTAIECDYILDGGAYLTISDVVMFRGILHCALAYRCDNVVIRGRVARTNSMPSGAFRGFGAPQAIWGIESHMDAIAARLGMTPHALRRKLHARAGDTTPTGQVLSKENGATECLNLALERSQFAQKLRQSSRGKLRKGQSKYYGAGLSFFAHGAAFTGDGEAKFQAKGRVELARLEDGRASTSASCPRKWARVSIPSSRRLPPTPSRWTPRASATPWPIPAWCPIPAPRWPRAPPWWWATSCTAPRSTSKRRWKPLPRCTSSAAKRPASKTRNSTPRAANRCPSAGWPAKCSMNSARPAAFSNSSCPPISGGIKTAFGATPIRAIPGPRTLPRSKLTPSPANSKSPA